MMRRPARILILTGAALLTLLVLGRAAAEIYTDALWFRGLGYGSVYWTRLGIHAAVRTLAGTVGAALVLVNLVAVAQQVGPIHLRRQYGNIEIAEQVPRKHVMAIIILVAVLGGWWLSGIQFGGARSMAVFAWLRQSSWGLDDPLFGRDLAFYVFSLPIYRSAVDYLLIVGIWSAVLALIGYILAGTIRWREGSLEVHDAARLHFVLLAAAMVLLLSLRYWLGRYGLMLEGTGIGGGIGYTDVHARLPAHRVLAGLAVLTAIALVYGAIRRSWVPPILGLGALGIVAVGAGQVYPAVVQKFRVEPNQIAREIPFIRWNLDFTRLAYDVHRLERRPMRYRPAPLPSWETLEPRLAALPLWDPEPLETTYNQIEALFAYHHFVNVAYDRYHTADGPQQVAIAVREFKLSGLPSEAQTWQTLHLNPKYVRGMGVVVSPTSLTERGGAPQRWVRNLDPVVRDPTAPEVFELSEPSIYFGQSMGGPGDGQRYVILVPGRDSAFVGDPGRTFPEGVQLSNLPRLLSFAWRFSDINLLFSRELSSESRILFRRSLHERVHALAPFLWWDNDPYPVLQGGRVVWLLDGYTASSAFPLSRPISVQGTGMTRYMRNSVKATIDAVTGDVQLYYVGGEDPVLETYSRIFPGLIQPIDSMPEPLRAHLRYPELFLRVQAEILKEYHLSRPESFYAGQDYWQLPASLNREGVAPLRPVYTTMALPGEDAPEYLLSVPYIARERHNMTALLVARNDPPHYGELVLIELPRDQQVPGPGQVAALMEQDPLISPQLSLWRQAGSNVELGRMRVVPLDSGFVYVRPIFLSARESSIPELARVLVSDGRAVSMAPTLAEAIEMIRGGEFETSDPDRQAPIIQTPADFPGVWPQRALDLLDQAEERLRKGDWAGFGARWEELRAFLNGVQTPGPPPDRY